MEKEVVMFILHDKKDIPELEKLFNSGYVLFNEILFKTYHVFCLRKEKPSPVETEYKIENITDFVKLNFNSDFEKQKAELFKKGYRVYHLSTQSAILVKYAEVTDKK